MHPHLCSSTATDDESRSSNHFIWEINRDQMMRWWMRRERQCDSIGLVPWAIYIVYLYYRRWGDSRWGWQMGRSQNTTLGQPQNICACLVVVVGRVCECRCNKSNNKCNFQKLHLNHWFVMLLLVLLIIMLLFFSIMCVQLLQSYRYTFVQIHLAFAGSLCMCIKFHRRRSFCITYCTFISSLIYMCVCMDFVRGTRHHQQQHLSYNLYTPAR